MQNDDEAHETEISELPVVSIWTGELHELPLYVSAYPGRSTAAQNDDDVHETEVMSKTSGVLSILAGALHELPLKVCA
jgi:hypothetical protein